MSRTTAFTFSSHNLCNCSLQTPDGRDLFVIRTSDTGAHSRNRDAGNPTIIARPKTSRAEAEIVACLQWPRWCDSRISVHSKEAGGAGNVRGDALLLPIDDDQAGSTMPWILSTPAGDWRWSTTNGEIELHDAYDRCMLRFHPNDNGFHSSPSKSSPSPSTLPYMHVATEALTFIDIIVCSLLVVVQEINSRRRGRSPAPVPARGIVAPRAVPGIGVMEARGRRMEWGM